MSEQRARMELPLVPRPRGCEVPLTATQRGYLRTLRACAGQAALSTRSSHLALRIQGALQEEWLRESLQVLVRRHESLRTRIETTPGPARQVIVASQPLHFDVVRIGGGSAADASAAMERASRDFLNEPLDVSVGPLFAARLFSHSQEEHVLVLALDHAITDVASNWILLRELCSLYAQAARGQQPSLPGPSIHYADYAVWQQRTEQAWMDTHAAYWTQRLRGCAPIHLPVEASGARADPPDAAACAVFQIPLGVTLSDRLRALAQQQKCLLSVVVLAVYAAVMARWCEREDVIVAFVSHGRHRRELQSMTGFLANTLHLRLDVNPRDSFHALLERTKAELRGAYEHQDLDRVRELLPHCDTELAFNWVAAPAGDSRICLAGLTIEPRVLEMPWSRRYFAMFQDTPSGIVARAWCQPDHSLPAAVEHFGDLLRRYAEHCSRQPHTQLAAAM